MRYVLAMAQRLSTFLTQQSRADFPEIGRPVWSWKFIDSGQLRLFGNRGAQPSSGTPHHHWRQVVAGI